MEYEAFAAVPAMSGDRALAGIALSFREPRTFDDATRTFLATLGEQCGLALERARAFDAERRARELSTTTLASIRDGFVALDREFRYRYVNPAAEELLRRPASELLGRDMWEAFPQAADAPLGRAYRRVMATRVAEAFESESLVLGMWLEGRIYPSPDGITVFFQDVTRRKRSQDANRFLVEVSRLLNESLDPSLVLNAVATAAVPTLGDWCAIDLLREPGSDGWPPVLDRVAIVHQDPAMVALGARLAEQSPTDWSDGTPMSAVLRDGAPLFVPAITDEMLATGARSPEHASLLRALRFRSVIVVPIAARGQTLGTLTLCMTESERRYDESDLALAGDVARRVGTALDNARRYAAAEAARASAEAANAAKSQFLATMSHELRTPLNAIAGYADLLLLGVRGDLDAGQRADVERIKRSGQHLLALINDILNFAKLEAGQIQYHLEPVPVRRLLEDLETLVAPQVAARRLRYETRLAPGTDATVLADGEKAQQVLLNLVTNALKFTEPGGAVTVSFDVAGDVVRVHVQDTGRGIPREQQSRIFEPFVQVDRHLTPVSLQGVGLGLAISRDLARGMGGDLLVASVDGVGSTFTLVLRRG
jgi:PAS domain S-box-containing protein